jgi:hypothetical protein
MNKVYISLGLAFSIIAACMIYLVIEGVSLRTEPIIKPSPIDDEYKNITFGVVHRMFPDLQGAEYVIWGLMPYTSEEAKILELLQAEHFVQLGLRPNIILINAKTTDDDIKNCAQPCWIVVDKNQASGLGENPILARIRGLRGEKYFSVTLQEFELDMKVPETCDTEKRLDFDCILPVSVREVRRRMKVDGPRYFFMRRYNEKDNFLFMQKRKA